MRLAQRQPVRRIQVGRRAFDRIQFANQLQHFGGAPSVGILRVVKLAARMGSTGDFRHLSHVINPVVAAVGIGLQVTAIRNNTHP